jgi:beta-glucosidase
MSDSTKWSPGAPGTLADGSTRARFPDGFLWGTATAAYQIEGAPDADGKGPSIWDTFSHEPGRTADGETGDVACDHYQRMPQDLELMSELGANAYRFSVSWPRVQPTGSGAVETRGLDFYERLVDGLLARSIAPILTLYHWDLPQALEDEGGWLNRDTAYHFGEYAGIVADRLGDRVHTWITINEAAVVSLMGYGLGMEAPGRALMFDSFPATHHVLLAHGLGVAAVRAAVPSARVAITHNISPAIPRSDSPDDIRAAAALDAIQNRTFMDSCLLGVYPPEEVLGVALDRSCVQAGDLEIISTPLDAIGINYYYPTLVTTAGIESPLPFDMVPLEGYEVTAMGWPVVPDGLRDLLVEYRRRYGERLPPVLITENGAAFPDSLDETTGPGGVLVEDPRRVEYLRTHIAAVADAMDNGVDVRGYFVWSLMDNFEWAEGYGKRFGLLYVDYPTQRRIPKLSFHWYRAFLAGAR